MWSAVGSVRFGDGNSGGSGDLLAEDEVPLVLAGILYEVGGCVTVSVVSQGHCGRHYS